MTRKQRTGPNQTLLFYKPTLSRPNQHLVENVVGWRSYGRDTARIHDPGIFPAGEQKLREAHPPDFERRETDREGLSAEGRDVDPSVPSPAAASAFPSGSSTASATPK